MTSLSHDAKENFLHAVAVAPTVCAEVQFYYLILLLRAGVDLHACGQPAHQNHIYCA